MVNTRYCSSDAPHTQRRHWPLLSVICCLSIAAFPIHAAIDITDNFSISGFGSTSWSKSDNETPLFVNRYITDESCYDCDTTFGLQLDYYLGDLKASAQLVKRPQDDWSEPQLEWAYLGYEYNNFEFWAGRLRLPLFLASEYYYVGQAYITARPNDAVYNSILGITAFNGFSARWLADVGEDQIAIMPFVGFHETSEVEINADTHLEFKTHSLLGINAQYTSDYFRWHLAYLNSKFDQTTKVNVTMPSPANPSQLINTTITMIEEDEEIDLYSLGAEYEFGNLTLTTEGQINKYLSSWYAGLHYRFDKLTPYVYYSQQYTEDDKKSGDNTLLGVRYDIHYNVSINAEWQHFGTNTGRGSFVATPTQDEADLYTIMLSFVF